MRNMHNASSDASCTVTTSAGSAVDRNCVNGDTIVGMVPSVQNSVFLRTNFEDDELLPFLRVVDELVVLVVLLLLTTGCSSSMGR